MKGALIRIAMVAVALPLVWYAMRPAPEPEPCPVCEVVVPSPCENTYGPLPTPREGWDAWGVVCPKGVEP